MADLIGSLIGGIGFSGSTIGAAIVRLRLDSDDYRRELAVANGQTTASANAMGGSMSRFGSIAHAGLTAAGIGVAAFAVNAVKAASDLGEVVNKTDVIFETNSAAVQAWAKTGAEAFGLSQAAALDAATGFGAMLQTAGLAVDKSADMSEALVQLAGDMASFNNIDPTEALEKLRSGLAGEAEPLRRFGVFLSEAAIQTQAVKDGIAKQGEELTEAQKIQARYNLILEQTVKQQGDFKRTADSMPNQLRTIKAEFQNVSAAVGKELLPVLTDLLKIVKDIVPFIGSLARGLHALSDAGGLVFGPIGVLIKAISDGIKPTDEMNKLIGQTLVNFEGMKQKADLAAKGVTDLHGSIDEIRQKGTTKHIVEIEYRYKGFDPSKPGMSTSAQQR